jgi:hypothetical protein
MSDSRVMSKPKLRQVKLNFNKCATPTIPTPSTILTHQSTTAFNPSSHTTSSQSSTSAAFSTATTAFSPSSSSITSSQSTTAAVFLTATELQMGLPVNIDRLLSLYPLILKKQTEKDGSTANSSKKE